MVAAGLITLAILSCIVLPLFGMFHEDIFAWWYSRIIEVESFESVPRQRNDYGGETHVLHCKLHYLWKTRRRTFVVTKGRDKWDFAGYWADTGKQDENMWRAVQEARNVAQAKELVKAK
jgi:hypothetical protein